MRKSIQITTMGLKKRIRYQPILLSTLLAGACTNEAVKEIVIIPKEDCATHLTTSSFKDALECYQNANSSDPRDMYGEAMAHVGVLFRDVLEPSRALLALFGIPALSGIEIEEEPDTAARFQPHVGLSINLLLDQILSATQEHTDEIMRLADNVYAAHASDDATWSHPFTVRIPFSRKVFLDEALVSENSFNIEGLFGSVELAHVEAIASAMSSLASVLAAHDLSITSADTFASSGNFTSILARESSLLTILDKDKEAQALVYLERLARAVEGAIAGLDARIGLDGYVIRARDLNPNGSFDVKDALSYQFFDRKAFGLESLDFGLADTDDTLWLTFNSNWPDDFMTDVANMGTVLKNHFAKSEPVAVSLNDLAPIFIVTGWNVGDLVDYVAIDFNTLLQSGKGIRDFMPMFRCDDFNCNPIESDEYVTDTVHFSATVTSDHPITAKHDAEWQEALRLANYQPENVDLTFSYSEPLTLDGIAYASDDTGPANIYRLYKDPTFAGALKVDHASFVDHVPNASQSQLEAGLAGKNPQFDLNAMLSWYTVQTKNKSPFDIIINFEGFDE